MVLPNECNDNRSDLSEVSKATTKSTFTYSMQSSTLGSELDYFLDSINDKQTTQIIGILTSARISRPCYTRGECHQTLCQPNLRHVSWWPQGSPERTYKNWRKCWPEHFSLPGIKTDTKCNEDQHKRSHRLERIAASVSVYEMRHPPCAANLRLSWRDQTGVNIAAWYRRDFLRPQSQTRPDQVSCDYSSDALERNIQQRSRENRQPCREC